VSRQLTDELKAWTPRIIEWLIGCAVLRLPKDQRERFGEEWRSHIYETPGEIGKLFNALGLLLAARKMPKPVTTFEPFDEPTQEQRRLIDDPVMPPRHTPDWRFTGGSRVLIVGPQEQPPHPSPMLWPSVQG
jgi:hypothetical protein